MGEDQADVGAGDVIKIRSSGGQAQNFRMERVTQQEGQLLEGARVERQIYEASQMSEDVVRQSGFVAPVPVHSLLLDVPLMTGEEVPNAPYIAVTGRPWPGSAAV